MSNGILRYKAKNFISKLEIAQKECYETEYWLELLLDAFVIQRRNRR